MFKQVFFYSTKIKRLFVVIARYGRELVFFFIYFFVNYPTNASPSVYTIDCLFLKKKSSSLLEFRSAREQKKKKNDYIRANRPIRCKKTKIGFSVYVILTTKSFSFLKYQNVKFKEWQVRAGCSVKSR